MNEQIDYLRLRPLNIFRDLDNNELETVCKYFFVKKVDKGFFLFAEGMPGELLYIILSGQVEIIKKTTDNKKIVLAEMGPNDIIGEMSLIDSEPRSATCRASENSVMLGITKKSFIEMLDANPRIAAKMLMNLLRIMSRRLRATTDKKIEEVVFLDN
jgi:CRP/FNR family transcriptional regulator, cyclic AMP receptor protein